MNGSNLTNGSNMASQTIIHTPLSFWIFLAIETIVTIFGNAMLCWLFIANRKLRTEQNYFIVSLSTSDLLVGLSVAPCEYCRMIRIKENAECQFFCGSIISFNMIASVINLVLIASDRYFSIKKPFRYVELFTKKRAVITIIVCWFTTIVLTCIPLSWGWVSKKDAVIANVIYTGILFGFTILAGILLAISYYSIVRTIRIKTRATKEKPSNPAGVKVCMISSVIFFFSWIPYVVVELLLQRESIYVSEHVMDAAYFILMLSPCLDPLLYAYYRRDFRSCLLVTYRRHSVSWKKCCNRLNSSDKHSLFRNKYRSTTVKKDRNAFSVQSQLVSRSPEATNATSL